MWRKEIYLKKLFFSFGVILLVSFVAGIEVPLPLRSEIKLSQSSGDFWRVINEIVIKQESSNIIITNFSDFLHKPSPGISEGDIPIGDFKVFWDSLNFLNFWQLREKYFPKYDSGFIPPLGAIGGVISVTFENEDGNKITKTIEFHDPHYCSEELKLVYSLLQNLERYAQFQPDLRDLLIYSEMTSERWGRFWYQDLAVAEIGRIKDPKYLDTLLYLLPREKKYATGIINALRNIGDKRAISALIKTLGEEMTEEEFNDKRINSIIQALFELTGQNFTYNQSDSLAAKKETVNKWINWWEENKDTFK